jgi:tRNA pseudouridine65 synthase
MINTEGQNPFPLGQGCTLIGHHQETDIWAIDKAPGILTHPNFQSKSKKETSKTLFDAKFNFQEEAYEWTDRAGELQKVFLVHRLDSPTSGIILVTTNRDTSSLLKTAFTNQKVQKTYHAIVRANGLIRSRIWRDKLYEVKKQGKLRVKWGQSGSEAVTEVQLAGDISQRKEFRLLRLKPKTGRTHQLRVQCSKRGMPIVGDQTYGDFSLNRRVEKSTKKSQLFLHATSISLSLDYKNRSLTVNFETNLPRSFGKLI